MARHLDKNGLQYLWQKILGKLVGKQDVMLQVTVANSVSSQAMSPNTLYVFQSRTTALTLTLGAALSGKASEYHCIIECGATAPTVTWPSGISWNGGSAPTIAANKKYEVSILNNIATFIEV